MIKFGINSSVCAHPDYLRHFDAVTLGTYAAIPIETQRAQYAAIRKAGKSVYLHPGVYAHPDEGVRTPAEGEDCYEYLDRLRVEFPQATGCDAVNEPWHQPPTCAGGAVGLFDHAAGYWPEIRINEYGILDGEIFNAWLSILRMIPDLYDAVGVQAHVAYHIATAGGYDMATVSRNLKALVALGKPVHVTEISVPSAGNGWTESMQASYIREFYNVCINAGVSNITYWDLCDAGAWNPSSGLLHDDGTPKAAWYTLKSIMDAQRKPPKPVRRWWQWWR